ERGGEHAALVDQLLLARRAPTTARIVGITGAPGAGKSTLVGALADLLLAQRRRPAALAVDPTSPISGGAILGDRVRMDRPREPTAFVRSVASRGAHGGLAASVPAMLRVLEAVGHDVVIVETVGVGQAELDVAALAGTTVVVVTPGWGDALQARKAGLFEVADVLVVNKADRPGADDAARDLERMLDEAPTTGEGWRPPVVRTVATVPSGVDLLLDAIERHGAHVETTDASHAARARARVEIRALIEQEVARALDAQAWVLDAVVRGELNRREAVQQVLRGLGERTPAT
ncbi:MAG TPA: methylmalonyl Co-A mutase-associated GTPase MeaB, partial [Acidimicrobiales bacterium]